MSRPLHALTLHQPWAWAIAEASKRVENRDWPPPRWLIGKHFAIHAGKSYDDEAAVGLSASGYVPPAKDTIATGSIVAIARLVGAVHQVAQPLGPIDSTRVVAVRTDEWFFGPWGWVLSDVVAIAPVPCRGLQKLWRCPDAVAEQVRDAFRAARAGREVAAP